MPRVAWVGRLVSVLLSVLLALGLGELLFRVFWLKQLTIRAGIEHPHFHHRLKPYETYAFTSGEFNASTRTNRFGLRGPDPAIPKPPGIIRILMVGDSFTFGFPVQDEETFCALIEQGLRAQGYPVEVINGGVSGAAPTLHYIALRDQFLDFEPDLVILWYDLGDLQEDHWFQKNLLYDEAGRIVRCDPYYIHGRFSVWEWLKHWSALAKYMDAKVLRTIERLRILGFGGYLKVKLRGERAKVAIARLKREQQAADLADYDRFLLLRESSTEEVIAPYWALSRRYLVMIRDLVAERGIPFMLGIYPYGMLVGPDQWAEGRVFWGFERGKTYDAHPALAIFERFSRDERVPLINTFGRFREAASGQKLFYDQDGHMTPAGQRLIAETVLSDPRVLTILRAKTAAMTEGRGDPTVSRTRRVVGAGDHG